MAVTFLFFLVLVFFVIQAQPGDFTQSFVLDPKISPADRSAIASAFGLDQPAWKQLFIYVGNFLRGDFGVSFEQYPRSVGSIIAERLPRTIMLFGTATVLSFYLGFSLGKIVAWRRGSLFEQVSTVSGVYLFTVFTPWFALVIIWLFALQFGWFPVGKFITPELWVTSDASSNAVFSAILGSAAAIGGALFVASLAVRMRRMRTATPLMLTTAGAAVGVTLLVWALSGYGKFAWDIVRHMALPVTTLTLISFAGTMLITRNSMLQTIREDYVFAARARGLPERVVRDRYVARNALLPVATSFVLSLAFAIDGGVVIETVFSWPGMGLTLLQSASSEDIPLAVGAFLFTGMFALVAHLVADVLYVILDPRIRYR